MQVAQSTLNSSLAPPSCTVQSDAHLELHWNSQNGTLTRQRQERTDTAHAPGAHHLADSPRQPARSDESTRRATHMPIGPTTRRRQLGADLRRIRERKGLTLEEAGARV